jgi:glutathione S-transferase
MILVGQYDSPFVRRVAATLHHYHMPFTRKPISVFRNVDEVRGINPLVRVPSLILEDGEVLVESGAILDYLDERAGPARALTPAHGPERRKVLQACGISTGISDKAVAIYYERFYHPGKALSRDYEARLLSQVDGGLRRLEHDCGSPWFIDSHMTQADVTIGCMLAHVKLRMPEAFPAHKFPKLHALAVHCELRDEFVATRPSAEEIGTAPPVQKG